MGTNYLLSVGSDMSYKAFSAEAWAKAAEVTILGMGMIFAVLSLLWGVLAIFKIVFARQPKKKETPATAEKAEPVVETPIIEQPSENDDALIAVITAAIEAYRAGEGIADESVSGFRVVSFRRADKGRSWNSNK